jgi:hypothetical protein
MSSTWRARVRPCLPELTDHPRACPLASDHAPPLQTVWRNPSSSPCPLLSVRARRTQPPARARHVPEEQRASDPCLLKHTWTLLPLTQASHPPLIDAPPNRSPSGSLSLLRSGKNTAVAIPMTPGQCRPPPLSLCLALASPLVPFAHDALNLGREPREPRVLLRRCPLVSDLRRGPTSGRPRLVRASADARRCLLEPPHSISASRRGVQPPAARSPATPPCQRRTPSWLLVAAGNASMWPLPRPSSLIEG